jgi:hypothetical protein
MVQSEQEQRPWVVRQSALHPLMHMGYLLHWWKAEEGYQANESRNQPTAKVLMQGWRDETKPFRARWPVTANR